MSDTGLVVVLGQLSHTGDDSSLIGSTLDTTARPGARSVVFVADGNVPVHRQIPSPPFAASVTSPAGDRAAVD